jgi:predicted nucleic acid-binding protein
MSKLSLPVVYWDSSAVLAALFRDVHSEDALKWAEIQGVHMISSLTAAEVTAVISRIHREHRITTVYANDSFTSFEKGPWRYLKLLPYREKLKSLSQKWPLRGADLWHLATAKTLQEQLPELHLLTYDKLLLTAAVGEGLQIL